MILGYRYSFYSVQFINNPFRQKFLHRIARFGKVRFLRIRNIPTKKSRHRSADFSKILEFIRCLYTSIISEAEVFRPVQSISFARPLGIKGIEGFNK